MERLTCRLLVKYIRASPNLFHMSSRLQPLTINPGLLPSLDNVRHWPWRSPLHPHLDHAQHWPWSVFPILTIVSPGWVFSSTSLSSAHVYGCSGLPGAWGRAAGSCGLRQSACVWRFCWLGACPPAFGRTHPGR
jgi:hypothetical protein